MTPPIPPPAATARLRHLPWVAAVLLLALTGVMAFGGTDPAGPLPRKIRGMDLVQYWAGGTILAAGDAEHLYVRKRAERELRALFPEKPPGYLIGYPPPIYQIAAMPQAAGLPPTAYPTAAKVTLLAMAVLHLGLSTLVLRRIEGLRPWFPWALTAAFLLPGAIQMVIVGQLAALWFGCLVAAWQLRAKRRPVLAGLCLAPLLLKPTLLAPVGLVFLALGELPVILGIIVGSAGVGALSLVAPGGWVGWTAWMHRAADPAAMLDHFWYFWARQVNLRTLLGALSADRSTASALGWLGMGLGLSLTAFTAKPAWALRRRAAESGSAPDPVHANLQLGATLSAAFLTSPHFLEYDFVMHLIGMAASAAWLISGRARWPRVGAAVLAGAWLAVAVIKLNAVVHVNVSTILTTAWVLWMGAELTAAVPAAQKNA